MIAHDLHSLGFDADTLDTLVDSAVRAGVTGVEEVGGFDLLAAYTDPSGARLALLGREGRIETMASLVAPTTHRAHVLRLTPTVARVDLVDADGQRLARFLADVDDPVEYPLTEPPATVEHLRVGAVANGYIRVYDSEEAYGASEEGAIGTSGQVQFAAGHLISPWLMELNAGRARPEEVSPAAEMTMVVQRVDRRTNELTGVDWWRVMGSVGVDLTLSLPCDLPHEPHPGSVLSGRVVPVVSSGVWEQGRFWG